MRVNINNIVSNYELANVLAYKISDSNVSKKKIVEIVERIKEDNYQQNNVLTSSNR